METSNMKFDMHCHTKEGSLDGKVPVEQYISLLQKKGFGGMLITDHDSYNGYRAWRDTLKGEKYRDFVVLKGIEYDTIDAGHILVILPEDVRLNIMELRGLPVKFLIDIVHENGGILGPAHPCGERFLSIAHTGKRKNQLAVMERFDFLEGFNACEDSVSNHNARRIAAKYHLPMFGGSDAHRAECVGMGYTEFAGRIASESDLIALVKEKGEAASVCGGAHYHGTTRQRIGRVNNILILSFWVYNHMGSMCYRHRRREELKKMHS
jgi:predicted metal-dependent phosphoesterase TrpH